MPVRIPDENDRASASAVDADSTMQADAAAQAEADRIEAWTKPTFAQGGRQQLQRDESYGHKERKTGRE